MNTKEVKIIELPKIIDHRGNLTFIETQKHIPFKMERVFWIYDVPGGETRGGHAYKHTEEVIIALSGSFDVIIDDGKTKKTFSLNRSYYGLYLPAGTWRHMENFSTNSLALVIASTPYNPEDYIRDYQEFLNNKDYSYNKTEEKNDIFKKLKFEKEFMTMSVWDCSLINLPKIENLSGNITVVESNLNIPFKLNRLFYIYDIPGGESRGAHAHKNCQQFIIAASGAFEVFLDDGKNKRTVLLNRPYLGLHIPPGIWAAEQGFSSGSICLVLTSEVYDEKDYIRNYNEFIRITYGN